ncbi:MAG: proline dehydrogenase family protein [Ignavibacteriales bacterium]|nr:proline dehydrogenase family protein [Ignavibacteriales bacterium]
MGITRNVLLWGSQSKQLQNTLTKYSFFQGAVKRFMPGEDLGSALAASEALKAEGVSTIFTHLGENISYEPEADLVTRHYLEVLDHIKKRKIDANISIKLTQLGLDISTELAYKKLETLTKRAGKHKNFVWIDMEGSPYVDRTLEIYRKAKKTHKNVGVCLQAYLHRTAKDLDSLLPLSPAIRLVKGAYKEDPSIAFQSKAEVDMNYLALVRHMLQKWGKNKNIIGIGTHDEQIIRAVQAADGSRERCEFEMLYGIKRDLQLRIARDGYKMRVLISYGAYWFPWYMRRLAERPANVWFVMKNLFS